MEWIIFACLFFVVGYLAHNELVAKKSNVQFISRISDRNRTIETKNKEILSKNSEISDKNNKVRKISQQLDDAKKECLLWKASLAEAEQNKGFPSLIKAINDYEYLRDTKVVSYLATKKHRAIKAAEIVKEETNRRRDAEALLRKTQEILDYYESIVPALAEIRDEEASENEEDILKDLDRKDLKDPVAGFLSKEDFNRLPTVKRNQLALDRFWKKHKSKKMIGRLYERYVGYIYEHAGYEVDYFGIFKGREDLGRDLICTKGNELIVIQCKNWSKFKEIHEKHIFQFFGTVYQYKDENPNKTVRARFYTTTKLSGISKRFARDLNIELFEDYEFDQVYPCITNPASK